MGSENGTNRGKDPGSQGQGYAATTETFENMVDSIDHKLHLFGCLLSSKANCAVTFEGHLAN